MAVAVRHHGSAEPGRRGDEDSSARTDRPALEVVRRRTRWPAVVGATMSMFVIAAMLGAAVFHTQLAERQLKIDRLEQEVDSAREQFDELRRDRAVLRSPQRIADEATELGMVQGETSRFVSVDPQALAVQLAAAGATDGDVASAIEHEDPLDQFRDVKAVSEEQP